MERLRKKDALVIVDVQNDFLPGGRLAVPHGEEVIPPLNRCIARFQKRGLSIIATRDWHSRDHCSFFSQGGRWPHHCIANSFGAEFPKSLKLPATAIIISKGVTYDREGYSAFEETELESLLRARRVQRLFVGGLATDYCVLQTVCDARRLGFFVFVLRDAIRAVNVSPEDGPRAEEEMIQFGAQPLPLDQIAA